MYDIRGADGTGTSANPVPYNSPNAKSYTVRKLADGNCWMTENLALPLAAGIAVEAASNTSATPVSFTPTGSGGTSNAATPMNGNTRYDSNTGQWYYSWYAATAGTGTSSQTNIDASSSICPVGWRLPSNYTISTTKSYGSITDIYGLTANGANDEHLFGHTVLESIPLSFLHAGYTMSGTIYNDNIGRYWSSTAYPSATYAYFLSYGTAQSFVRPQDPNGRKYYGFTVRCIAL